MRQQQAAYTNNWKQLQGQGLLFIFIQNFVWNFLLKFYYLFINFITFFIFCFYKISVKFSIKFSIKLFIKLLENFHWILCNFDSDKVASEGIQKITPITKSIYQKRWILTIFKLHFKLLLNKFYCSINYRL